MPISRNILLPLAIMLSVAAVPSIHAKKTPSPAPGIEELKAEIAASPGKSGGIYYAYPVTADECPAPPEGFEPVAINHYGRHGSRWIIKEWQYPMAVEALASQQKNGNLTAFGEDVLKRLRIIAGHGKGHAGELSPIGERQHKAIARRMAQRFPALFADSAVIEARSSVEPRCIISMAAFSEQLKEMNPALKVRRHATPSDMNFIAYSTPEVKAFGNDSAAWQRDRIAFSDSVIKPARLMAKLFRRPVEVPEQHLLMRTLHDIAVDIQDVELDVELLDIFTPEELFALWQALNYKMYVRHAGSAIGNGIPAQSAASLLADFIATSDRMLMSATSPKVNLRFGHDTNLIRLLTLMQIDGCARTESDPRLFCTAWQDFRVSPMGANLQLIFYRNKDGKVLVLIRHNEQPASLPIPSYKGTDFYEWDRLREFWLSAVS